MLSRELTRFRMQIVDENNSIREIEEKISGGLIEELILQAHNELKLLRIMKAWKPWEHMKETEEEKKAFLQHFSSFRQGNPFFSVWEQHEAKRHDPTPRRER